jgi:nitronate monooxygenase
MQTAMTRLLGCDLPIIQAPMAGGGDTPRLVAAVADAGGFGFLGAAYLDPRQIAAAARDVRALTPRPFGINLFAPVPAQPGAAAGAARAQLEPYYRELGLEPPPLPATPSSTVFADQAAAAIDCGASVLSFTFGVLPDAIAAAARARGVRLIGTATSVAEARALEQSGVDAIVAQGSEAGGHRGTFLGEFADAMIGTMALVPQVVDAVRVPVIASGGIMDGRGIAAALALGAAAVQLGTAFLTCAEAGIADAYKEAILHAAETDTRVTHAFSGRAARGIVNRFMREIDAAGAGAVAAFPLQNALTRPLRSAAARQGRAEFLSLWAGQGAPLARRQGAADLVARLEQETRAATERLGSKSA